MNVYEITISPIISNTVLNKPRKGFFNEKSFEKEFGTKKFNHSEVTGLYISELVIKKVLEEYKPYLRIGKHINSTINQKMMGSDREHIGIKLYNDRQAIIDIEIVIAHNITDDLASFALPREKFNILRPDPSKIKLAITKEGDIYKPLMKKSSIETSKEELMILNNLLDVYVPDEVKKKYKIVEKIKNLSDDVIYSET